jgi:type I restriction enzyme R subunit
VTAVPPSNFDFLAVHDARLVRLGADAERFFAADPDVCLLRLRQLGERVAQLTAALSGFYSAGVESQLDLLRRLQDEGIVPPEAGELFHALRKVGNAAAHRAAGTHQDALSHLQVAVELGAWFHRTFGPDPGFRPAPFTPPPAPEDRAAVEEELRTLREQLDTLRRELEEQRSAALTAELTALQEHAGPTSPAAVEALRDRARSAAQEIVLDEATTRQLIDEQLRQAGWEADPQTLRYGNGARPQKGRNLAIAEWPTLNGPADYVLFSGLVPLAVVEAKRQMRNVPGSIEQARRYSRGFRGLPPDVPAAAPGGPWGGHHIPFLFATNGRPYLRQIETRSGIWFLDARRPQNHPRALTAWYTPEGLSALLEQDVDRAEAALREEPVEALSFLYPFQADAIRKVEEALAQGQRACLVAMATGTGKTKTAIGLVYRLLKTGRFRRVLFLVDRHALGEQAVTSFEHTRVESVFSFAQIFDIKEPGETPEPDTRVHVATVQSVVRRLLSDDPGTRPQVDEYDCLVVDECHRGYLLDREMGDDEFAFRDQDDYISAYRRVLDHFDAVKIGLTATPALHTVQIFGYPVVRYTYRQAVLDGYLVDHEPPIQIRTQLAMDGMIWRAGEEMLLLEVPAHRIDTVTLPDEVKIEIDGFNSKVITEEFNRAVCGELAKHIDPALREKTIIFCVNDSHADLVVDQLKKAFVRQYGEVDDEAVQKITGAADQPRQKIRFFKNDPLPSVAVTVDLLTTGIDVPDVANLVFLRRVKSRILYDQMLGRGTRLCPELHKESFRIFDAVNLYSALSEVTEMRPVAVSPRLSFAQLVEEILAARAADAGEERLRSLLDELIAKIRRKRSALQEGHAEEMRGRFGLSPQELADKLRNGPLAQALDWLVVNPGVADFLDRVTGQGRSYIISLHADEVREVSRGYGEGINRPEEYLEAFAAFLRNSLDRIPALLVVTQRPRNLTREQLREVKAILDAAGYSETSLRTAWREMTNQDIAASIIGHIRQAALGDPLIPYGERVDRALKKILASRMWTKPQRTWLERIAQQLKTEVIVDRATFEQGAFQHDGGFRRLDRMFDGRLTDLLGELQDEVWQQAV